MRPIYLLTLLIGRLPRISYPCQQFRAVWTEKIQACTIFSTTLVAVNCTFPCLKMILPQIIFKGACNQICMIVGFVIENSEDGSCVISSKRSVSKTRKEYPHIKFNCFYSQLFSQQKQQAEEEKEKVFFISQAKTTHRLDNDPLIDAYINTYIYTASGSTQFRSKNQLRWLKLIVDFMKVIFIINFMGQVPKELYRRPRPVLRCSPNPIQLYLYVVTQLVNTVYQM